jgi:hypothetical protein
MKIFFPPDVKRKLDAIIQVCDIEVSLLGKVKKLPRRPDFVVTGLELFRQECSEVSTELDSEALGRFFSELLARGESLEDWRCWIHSHVDSQVFFSRIDERTINSFLGDWLISICVNRRGDSACRLDIFSPVHVTCHDVEVAVLLEPDAALLEQAKAEVADKVRKKPFPIFFDDDSVPLLPGYRRYWSWGEGLEEESEHED